jgi:peptide/nickel transport system permease protein
MIRYLLQRIGQTVIVIFGVTVVTFVIMNFAPGHPMQANPEMRIDPTAVERWLALRQLDGPLPARYIAWLSRIFQGDFGISLIYNRPVTELMLERLPATLLLTVTAFLLSLCLAVIVGTYVAVKRDGAADRLVGIVSLTGISLPGFWFGMVLIMVFSYRLPWLPTVGMRTPGDGSCIDIARHMVLPVTVLVAGSFSHYVRYAREAVLAILEEDYVRTARARGLPQSRIILRHVLPNAALPMLTIAALSIPMLFTGALLAEYVFSWPGIGRWIILATMGRDYPVIMAVTLLTALLVAVSNTLADVLYILIDPRLRL